MISLKQVKIPLIVTVLVLIGLALAYAILPSSWTRWLISSDSASSIVVSGNIEAHESVLSFNVVQSRITELPFDEGKTVKAGTLLARLDDADYRQQLSIAAAALDTQRHQRAATDQALKAADQTVINDQADLNQKKLDLDRNQALWIKHFVDTDVRDQAQTAYAQAVAALARDQALEKLAQRNLELADANVHGAEESLKLAQIVLAYTVLTAPYDGVILVRQAEVGEVVAPGTPIFTLADLNHIWLRGYVNETDIGKVRYGEPVVVTTDTYPGKRYHGVISLISSSAEFTPKSVETHEERVTLVYRIRVDVDNPSHELLPGMPADAHIDLLPPE